MTRIQRTPCAATVILALLLAWGCGPLGEPDEQSLYPAAAGSDGTAAEAYLCRIGTKATSSVSSSSALRAALATAKPGSTIVVQQGSYSGDFTLSRPGEATRPITIRAAGQVTFKGSVFVLAGDHAVLTGMTFDDGMVTIRGDRNRVTRNVFQDGGTGGNTSKLHSAVHTEGGASHNRIDHNEVVRWKRRAIRNTKLTSRTQDNRFDHNHLHELKGVWANSGEAFQVGTGHADPKYTPRTIIEYNLVEGHALEGEIVSLKACGNTVRRNTFSSSPKGSVQVRSSAGNTLAQNTLIGVKSLSVYGDDNKVIGNRLVGADLLVRSGDATYTELAQGLYKGAHPAARRTLVAGNVLEQGGVIGLGKRGTGSVVYPRSFPAEKTTLAVNKGQVVTQGPVKGTKTLSQYSGTIGKAVQLKASQVGPKADDPRCAGGASVPAPSPTQGGSSTPASPAPAAGAVLLDLEAEAATLGGGFEVRQRSDASGGKHVLATGGSSYTSPGGPGHVTFQLAVPRDARYHVWARTIAPDGGSDSFFVALDGKLVMDPWHIKRGSAWRWHEVVALDLKQGQRALSFRLREDGVLLDRLVVTDDGGWAP